MGALNATKRFAVDDQLFRGQVVAIDCAPSGSYVNPGGDTLDFTGIVPGAKLPIAWFPAATIAGNLCTYIPSGARNTGKVRFNLAAGTEKTSSAYAGSGQDNFTMIFIFPVN